MATQQPQQMPPPQPTSAAAAAAAAATTYVQADPSNFRAVVQKLTGAPDDSPDKLPLTSNKVGLARRPAPLSAAKRQRLLQDRRCTASELAIELGPTASRRYRPRHQKQQLCGHGDEVSDLLSPVSTVDHYHLLLSSPSPTTPSSSSSPPASTAEVKGERAVAEEGFYLHPSPRGGGEPPKLLPLFPLHSPRHSC